MPPPTRSAFSLIELLAAVAIIALLAGFSLPVAVGLNDSSRFDQSLLRIASVMEQCHTYAIANQTYVYVGILTTDTATQEVSLAAIASRTGTDITNGWKNSINNLYDPDEGAVYLGKVLKFSQLFLKEGSQVAGNIVSRPQATSISLTSGIGFPVSNRSFPILFCFAPDGTVSNHAAINASFEFAIQSVNHSKDVAIVQIVGLTGITKAYSP